jgi:hypothetical protein
MYSTRRPCMFVMSFSHEAHAIPANGFLLSITSSSLGCLCYFALSISNRFLICFSKSRCSFLF